MEEQDKKNIIQDVALEIAKSFFRGDDEEDFKRLVRIAVREMEMAVMPLIH